MRNYSFTTMLIASLLLAACAAPPQAPTTAPTPPPPVETEAPVTTTLTTQTWQWVSFTNPVEMYEIESPENYTVTFHDDGTVNIKADCNLANANYTDEEGSLQIQVGPMTLAACPPDSRSDDFINYLSYAAIYFFKDGNLYIDLFADGGTMEFTLAGG